MRARQLEAWDGKPPADTANADDDLVSPKAQTRLGDDGVRVGEAHQPGFLVHGHSGRIDLLAQRRVRKHVCDDLARTRQQPGIIQRRRAHGDAISTELPSFAHEPGRMSQRAYRNRSIVRGHAAECRTGHQHGAGTEVRRTQRRHRSCRSCADYENV